MTRMPIAVGAQSDRPPCSPATTSAESVVSPHAQSSDDPEPPLGRQCAVCYTAVLSPPPTAPEFSTLALFGL